MAGLDPPWALQLLRCAPELRRAQPSVTRWSGSGGARCRRRSQKGPVTWARMSGSRGLAASCPHRASLARPATLPYDLRQEPSAVIPRAGICAGGAGTTGVPTGAIAQRLAREELSLAAPAVRRQRSGERAAYIEFMESKPTVALDSEAPRVALRLQARLRRLHAGARSRSSRRPRRRAAPPPPRPRRVTHAAPRPTSSPTSARSTSAGSTPGGLPLDVRLLHGGAPPLGGRGLPPHHRRPCRPQAPGAARDAPRRAAPPERHGAAGARCSPRRTATLSSRGRLTSPSARSRSSSPSSRHGPTFRP